MKEVLWNPNQWDPDKDLGSSSYVADRLNQDKGVSKATVNKKWLAQIQVNKKATYIGLFENEKDAASAYNDYATRLHGEFAWLNKV